MENLQYKLIINKYWQVCPVEKIEGDDLNVPSECHLVDLERHSNCRSDANAIIRSLPFVSYNKKRKSSSVLMKFLLFLEVVAFHCDEFDSIW